MNRSTLFSLASMTLILTCTSISQARTVLCVDKSLQDATYSVQFNGLDGGDMTFTLGVPHGEDQIENVYGKCETEEDTTELAWRCEGQSAQGVGYWVRLLGEQPSALRATVTRSGGSPQSLPCE